MAKRAAEGGNQLRVIPLGLQRQVHGSRRVLFVGKVNMPHGVALSEVACSYAANYAHDGAYVRYPRVSRDLHATVDFVANGVAIGEILVRQKLIDDHYFGRVGTVGIGDVAALQQRDAHGLKIARSRGVPARYRRVLPLRE